MRSLQLPAELCRAAEEKFGKKYGGLESFLEFVLRELVRDETPLDESEQRVIEQRLKDLGYL
jgi:hypothetical protein